MKYFEVGFDTRCGWCSINIITVNAGNEEREAVTETAERRAQRRGYTVLYVSEVTKEYAERLWRRRMPMYPIDEQAEQAHDPSFQA